MRAEVHRSITKEVAERLGLPPSLLPPLCEGSLAPDLRADYETRVYLTPSGRIRTRSVRVRHHGTPPRVMKGMASKARHLWLKAQEAPERGEAGWFCRLLGRTKEDLWRKAGYLAGRVLHYLQDNVVVGPSLDPSTHERLERALTRIPPSSCLERAQLRALVGKGEVYREIDSVGTMDDPEGAMRRAVEHSYSVASSLFSPPEAPPHLNHLANEAYRFFKRHRFLLPYSAGLLLFSLLLFPLLSFPALLLLFPFSSLFLLTLLVMGSGEINRVLRAARYLPFSLLSSCLGPLVADVWLGWKGISACALLVLPFCLPLRAKAWRRIKGEVDWFRWILNPYMGEGYR